MVSSSNDDSSYSSSEVRDDDDESWSESHSSETEEDFEALGGDSIVDDDVKNGRVEIAGYESMVFHDSDGDIEGQSTGKVSSSDEASKNSATEKRRSHTLIAKDYTTTLLKLRVMLWLVLGCIMVISVSGIYAYSKVKEHSVYVSEFEGFAAKVIDSFQSDAQRKLEALDSLSATATVFALDHKQAWPNVTIPHISPLLERHLTVIGAAAIHILPIVPKHGRKQWEEYAMKSSDWMYVPALCHAHNTFACDARLALTISSFHCIYRDEAVDEALLISGETSNHEVIGQHGEGNGDHEHGRGLDAESGSDASNRFDDMHRMQLKHHNSPYIQDENGTDSTEGPYAIVWQYAPISPDRSIINYNLFANGDFAEETKPLLLHNYATLSRIHTFSHDWEKQSRFESFMSEHLHHHTDIQSMAHEPYVYMHYPVHQDFGHNSSTVAILTATLYWRHYFQNVLPEGVEGVICVVKNSVGQAFTYQMDGPEATLLGLQDLHDPSYNHMEHEGTYTSRLDMTSEAIMSRFSLPLDEKSMTYSLRVYPSSTFEANYRTSSPYIVALSMMLLFIITALVFKVYDFIIGRRQTALLEKAAKTDDIVASLFPETVRARVMGESTEFSDAGKGKEKKVGSGDSVSGRSARTIGSMYDSNGVIADFYPEATVLCMYLPAVHRSSLQT
jgi:hypothetical protein